MGSKLCLELDSDEGGRCSHRMLLLFSFNYKVLTKLSTHWKISLRSLLFSERKRRRRSSHLGEREVAGIPGRSGGRKGRLW